MTEQNDWAWPTLIQSLQRDITHLRELHDEVRRESLAAREAHRKEIDTLIEQLRSIRNDLEPIVRERTDVQKLRQQTWWAWIERLGWAGLILTGYSIWHYFKEHYGGH